MRILALSHEYPPIGGGGGNAAYHLLNGMADKGHEITLITTEYKTDQYRDDRDNFIIREVASKREKIDTSSFAEMLDYLLKAYREAKAILKNKSVKIDACIAFFGIPSGPIAYLVKKKYDIPYIIRLGGGDIPGAQKRFALIYKLLAPVIKLIWKNADALVANSKGLMNEAVAYYDTGSCMVIPNGVDTDYFSPSKVEHQYKSTEDIFRILFVSRLIKGKGLQFVIPELKRIANSTGRDIKLIIVGDGPYRTELESISKETGSIDMVEFVGRQNGDDLLKYYREADMFILPTEREGMPNVVLEAMSCGLPVIMTPCSGSEELIDGNGYITGIDDFTENIIGMIRSDKKRIEMGKKSRERVESLYTWDRTIEKYKLLLDEIV